MAEPKQDILRVLLAFIGKFPHGSMSDNEIAGFTGLSSPDALHHLEEMKSQGWISLTDSPFSRGEKWVRLTEGGS